MTMTSTIPAITRDSVTSHTLLAGLALGVTWDILLSDVGPFGPGMAVWVTMLGVLAVVLNRNETVAWRKTLVIWSSVAVLATLMPVFRATEVLIPLSLLVLAVCGGTILLQARGTALLVARVSDYVRAGLRLPAQVLIGIWPMLGQVQLRETSKSARAKGIARGVLMVAPLMLIFVGLFSSADANFERYASSLGDLLSYETPEHLLIITIMSWVATGLLTCSVPKTADDSSVPAQSRASRITLGDEEIAVIMGSLAALFLVFVVMQASYLFGGREMIERVSGLTLAAYARRGFFELLAVSTLTLVVVLWISATQCNQRIFRPLATVLVGCVLLILISAAQRLHLYTDEFGLTLSRVFAVALMVWLAGNLLSFAATVLRGRSTGFASGLVVSGVITSVLLGTINPTAVVARVNVERAINGNQQLDVSYLTGLGADTVPAVLERLHELPAQSQCLMAYHLVNNHGDINIRSQNNWSNDWRQWNASRAAADRAVMSRYDELSVLARIDPEQPPPAFFNPCLPTL